MNLLADLAEVGLRAVDSALTESARRLDRWTGIQPNGGDPELPSGHPDDVTSALANDALRVLRRRWWAPGGWLTAGGEMATRTLERGFAGLPQLPPAALAVLPIRLPLSIATLATQEGLRAMAAARAVSPEQMADFLGFVVETFSDLDIFFALRYRQELERYEELLQAHPDDARTRFQLGRTYLKLGLFDQAAAALRQVTEVTEASSSLRRDALFGALVAATRAGDLEAAFADGAACLDLDAGHDNARFWLFLAAEQAGGYPEDMPPRQRMEVRDGIHPTAVRFEDVTSEIGLDKISGGRGTAVADFFGDGRQHVAVSGAHAGISLFKNRGDGTFEDASVGSGLERCVYGFALSAADYDNDGLPDLFVSSLGFYDGRSLLFHNEGGGRFRDVTREAGLGQWGPAFTATWLDIDGNGLLDLYVVHNLGGLFDRKVPNRLYRNQGDGTFVDITREAGLDTVWSSIGACWGDFRNVGLPDLFVSSLGRAQLFRNRGDGTFEDVSRAAGVDRSPAIGSVAMAVDLDDDGWLDIVQATYSRPSEAIHTLRFGRGPEDGSPLRIWRNNRDGTFSLASADWGVSGCWGTMSLAAGDFENTGRQGLLLGNGDPSMERTEASVLLANDGSRLSNVTFTAGLPLTGKGHGVNFADLGADGRLHAMVASGGLYPGDLESTAVYRPKQRPGNYLGVQLVGTRSNRDALGARLTLGLNGQVQTRHVSGGSGFGWAPTRQHFGLGDADRVGPLAIRWPSGLEETVHDLPINAHVEIIEGTAAWQPLSADDASEGSQAMEDLPS